MQVSKQHYAFNEYVNMQRWCSYYYQVNEAVLHGAKNILLIGGGDGIVPSVLKALGIEVTTFDFDEELNPDIIGDIRELRKYVKKNIYDCIICCQVLEHLEFKYFDGIIESFSEIIKKDGAVIISLPQRRAWIKNCIYFTWWGLNHLLTFPMFWRGKFKFNGEHYWEVSSPGYGRKNIIKHLKRYLDFEKSFTPLEFPYHWFCIMKAKL